MNNEEIKDVVKTALNSSIDREYTLDSLGIDTDEFKGEAADILRNRVREIISQKMDDF